MQTTPITLSVVLLAAAAASRAQKPEPEVPRTVSGQVPRPGASRESVRSDPLVGDALEASERLARGDGKYSMLLRQFEDPSEHARYIEAGYQQRTEYHGQRDLPAGYWVYARPYWFIFRDVATHSFEARHWGPEQAIGPPDTEGHGDRHKAWAAKLENNPAGEWLLVEFPCGIKATAVEIHENFKAGSVARVGLFRDDGSEIEVWRAEQVAAVEGRRELRVPLPLGFTPRRVKIYLDSATVEGWNEIDAVGLVDDRGALHWATAVAASTTYAPIRPPQMPWPQPANQPANQPRPQPLPQPFPIPAGLAEIPVGPPVAPPPDVLADPPAVISDNHPAVRATATDGVDQAGLEARVAELERALAEQQALVEALRREVEALRESLNRDG